MRSAEPALRPVIHRSLRRALAVAVILTFGAQSWYVASWSYWRAGSQPRVVLTGASDQDRENAAAALATFRAAGLRLPPVKVTFHARPDCPFPPQLAGRAYEGRLHHRIELCSSGVRHLVHELAHVWTYENLDGSERLAFSRMRGLSAWNSVRQPWHDRGMEHAAEVLTWALLRLPDDQVLTPPHQREGLASAYELLLGFS